MSLDFDAIRERAAAATPGPWTADHEWCQINTPDGRRLFEVLLGDNDTRENAQQAIADAEFVAHANQDVPALLAEVASLTAELEQMKQVVAAARSVFEVEHRRAEKAEAEQDRLRADLDIATVKLNAHERHNRELRAEYEQGVTCACCGGKVMGREGHVIKVCPICGFDNFPEGGVHAAYYIHMLDHERRGKGKEE